MCPKTPDSPLENTSPMPVNSAIPSQLTPAEPPAAPITRPASRPIRPPAPCGPIPEAPADESLPFMVDVTVTARVDRTRCRRRRITAAGAARRPPNGSDRCCAHTALRGTTMGMNDRSLDLRWTLFAVVIFCITLTVGAGTALGEDGFTPRRWQVSRSYPADRVDLRQYPHFFSIFQAGWEDIEAEPDGRLPLADLRPRQFDGGDCVLIRTTCVCDAPVTAAVVLASDDDLVVFVNGQRQTIEPAAQGRQHRCAAQAPPGTERTHAGGDHDGRCADAHLPFGSRDAARPPRRTTA
jgi:hypothetical protein